ncbi:hypothetical protein SAMN05216503_0459 [Polaribacter sp. KT25b]|uniref:hypothetical protein n=1 Tax=Polaribacter sp. KT25b TaxID=1855336 RepID=UPI00087BD902|nr:hypothetical protein [Polaribacter sp. KT25b]SDR69539.1 hypothetical protein SAMN05216503_0459 [Polaribacter sp. KT25b]
MKNSITIIALILTVNIYSQQGKLFFETNYNTFSHSNLSDFQEEFKGDLSSIPLKTVDNFPANIGFTLGYEIIPSNISLFLAYNATGGKLSYSDYSGIVKIEEALNAISFGAIYYIDLSDKKDFRIGLKAFSMYSSLSLDSYSEIQNYIEEDLVKLNSIDLGVGAQLNYEYPLSFLILKANFGFDLVLGGKLIFKENTETHLIDNSNNSVKTGWSGLRTGIGIIIPIN